jgi:hypothetical protein
MIGLNFCRFIHRYTIVGIIISCCLIKRNCIHHDKRLEQASHQIRCVCWGYGTFVSKPVVTIMQNGVISRLINLN